MGDGNGDRLAPGRGFTCIDFAYPVDLGAVGLSGNQRGPVRAFVNNARIVAAGVGELGDFDVGGCRAPAQDVIAGCGNCGIGFDVGCCEECAGCRRQESQGNERPPSQSVPVSAGG